MTGNSPINFSYQLSKIEADVIDRIIVENNYKAIVEQSVKKVITMIIKKYCRLTVDKILYRLLGQRSAMENVLYMSEMQEIADRFYKLGVVADGDLFTVEQYDYLGGEPFNVTPCFSFTTLETAVEFIEYTIAHLYEDPNDWVIQHNGHLQ